MNDKVFGWMSAACVATAIFFSAFDADAKVADSPDLAGRSVAAVVSGNGVASLAGGGKKLLSASKLVVLEFSLSDAETSVPYAVFVPKSNRPEIIANGIRVELDPVKRGEGCVVPLQGRHLKVGANRLVVQRGEDELPADWVGLSVFSMLDGAEEVHFEQLFATPGIMASPAQDSRQANYDVLWYDNYFQPNMSAVSITSGTTLMGGKVINAPLRYVVMDFEENSGLMDVAGVDDGNGVALPWAWISSSTRLEIDLGTLKPVGTEFKVRVRFSGTPDTDGQFGAPYRRGTHGPSVTSVIYTFSQPFGARKWWPCKDLPYDKATTTTMRVRVPTGASWQVVSNGKLGSVTNNGDGTETWVWNNSYPIASYLVSLCVSNYIYVSTTYTALDAVTTMAISHAIYPQNIGLESTGAAGTLQVMNFFASRFGEYPFLTEKYFTASHNSGSGMEHQTCTSMPGGDVQDGRQRRNVHELAHHWFGDKITCESFDHVWLNEGIATYCEALWYEFYTGTASYFSYVNAWTITFSAAIVGPDADAMSNNVQYRRGAWVLHMLRRRLGDTAFFQGLRDFAQAPAYAYSTADTNDFRGVMEAASGRNLTTFFNQFLYRPNGDGAAQPIYRYSGYTRRSGGQTTLTLTLMQTQTGSVPFEVPMDVRLTNAVSATQDIAVENTALTQTFDVPLGSFAPLVADLDVSNWLFEARQLSIRTVGLADATRGQSYNSTLTALNNSGSVTWTPISGVPSGMTLSSGGVLSGTPSAAGTYLIQVQAADSSRSMQTTLQLVVAPPAGVSEGEWKSQ